MNLRIYKATLLILALSIASVFSSNGQIVEWDDCEKFLGNISSGGTPSTWLNYWNQVTPENAGKWGSVEGTRDNMNWSGLDVAYNLAKNNDYVFKQHVLVWGNQQPSWIEDLSEEEQLAEIEEWVMEYCERYPLTDFIEVVNEPLNDPPFGNGNGNYGAALGGSGQTGFDWIIKAFEIAKEYCPNAALMINEYNILNNSSSLGSYLFIVDLLIERQLIDAIGVQAHEFTVFNMSAADITAALDEIATKGLPIYITELDIGSGNNDQPVNDDIQLNKYEQIFPALWGHPAVKGITLWGYRENNTWRTTAHLLNSNRSERPAMEWLKGYVTQYNSDCENVTHINDNLGQNNIFNVYPNPSSSKLINISSEQIIRQIVIRDMGGKVIEKLKPESNQRSLKINLNLEHGIYLIEIMGADSAEVQRLLIN